MAVKSIGARYLVFVLTNSFGRKRAATKRVITFMPVDRGEKAPRHSYRDANIEDEKRLRSRAILDHEYIWPWGCLEPYDRRIGDFICG